MTDYFTLMEELESRTLLSAVPVATPDFSINRRAGAVAPFASASPSGLTPTQIRHAYGIDSAQFGTIVGDGSGQTIAIIDAYDAPNITTDFATFNSVFGLPSTTLTVIGQNGTSTRPGTDPAGKGNSWAVETSLDVEWAHVVAPNANILLVEANSNSLSDLFTAVNTARNYAGVSVISMSWGSSEFSSEISYDSYFVTPSGHNGVTFVASSGDYGGVSYPAASANVLAVGGTRLSVDSGGNWLSETGWGNGTSTGTSGGSGGGISSYESRPSYQAGVVTQSTVYRTTPDVAMDADPASGVAVIDSWDFGTSTPWISVGGTSLAAPMWAGVIAIADQGRVLSGQQTMDSRSDTLPKIYALPSADFHDITSGNNGYAAGAGYDLVTGRGTPIVNKVVADLAVAPAPVPAIGALSVSPGSGTAGTTVTLTATNVQETTAAASITSVSFYRESNSTSGLQTGGDTLVGVGVQSGTTWTISTSTTGLAAGTYTYYAVATDSNNVTSNVVSATFQVTVPVTAPANDNFASATTLTGTSLTWTGTNKGATRESGEPIIANTTGGASIWFKWVAPSSGKVTLTTKGSSFDTLLGVYTGSAVSSLALVASNDDVSRTVLTSSVSFNATAGKTYYFAVDGYLGATGSVALNLALTTVKVKTNSIATAVITGSQPAWTASSSTSGTALWVSWVAPSNGTLSLASQGVGATLAAYVAADSNPRATGAGNGLNLSITAGQTYYFAIDAGGVAGDILLSFQLR